MNKRQYKKYKKRINYGLEYGFCHVPSVKEIRLLERAYKDYMCKNRKQIQLEVNRLFSDWWNDLILD